MRSLFHLLTARASNSVDVLQDKGTVSLGGAGDAASSEVEQMYGALLRGPRKLRPPEGMSLPLRTPQGTRALSEAIHGLLEGHVEYIHHAHHHLLPVGCSLARLSHQDACSARHDLVIKAWIGSCLMVN